MPGSHRCQSEPDNLYGIFSCFPGGPAFAPVSCVLWSMEERGLNNARKASSAQTLNGFMTKVLSDIQFCWHSVARRMEGSATL